jgi:hypothetical protein
MSTLSERYHQYTPKSPLSLHARRLIIAKEFGLRLHAGMLKILSREFMDQLDRCKNIAAKRILLGVSR